jgi:hypothetical protein
MKRNLGELFEEYLRLKEEVEADLRDPQREKDKWGNSVVERARLEWGRCRTEISEQMGAHERVDYDDCMGRKWTFCNYSDGARAFKRKDKRDLGAVDRQGRIKRKEITELEELILGGSEEEA